MVSRLSFIQTAGLAVGAIGSGGIVPAFAKSLAPKVQSETLVKIFYDSPSEEQLRVADQRLPLVPHRLAHIKTKFPHQLQSHP